MSDYSMQVIERSQDGDFITADICSIMLESRIIFLSGELDSDLGNGIITQLIYLASVSPDPIDIYINSSGGNAVEALAVLDTMRFIKPVVRTFCVGEACSGAALILSGGQKGYRAALPNARVLLHELRGGVNGTRSEMLAYSEESNRVMDLITEIFSKQTGQPYDKIKTDLSCEFFLSAKEALDYGIIDHINDRGEDK